MMKALSMRPHALLRFLDKLVVQPGAKPCMARRHNAQTFPLGTDKYEVSVDEPAARKVWTASDKSTRFGKR